MGCERRATGGAGSAMGEGSMGGAFGVEGAGSHAAKKTTVGNRDKQRAMRMSLTFNNTLPSGCRMLFASAASVP
ncbi:MAG TPA: hypothetical protein DCL48_16660 [Alphaproteobacteria bacterium]|nr:hypothetical protein [Alphaproteobacteria bacterium]